MHTHASFCSRATSGHRHTEDWLFTRGAGLAMLSALIALALVLLALASTVGAGLELSTRGQAGDARSVLSLVIANVLVLPLVVWATLERAPLDAETKVALWIVTLAPGGASAPPLARAAGGSASVVGWGYLALALCSPALVWAGFARSASSLSGRPGALLAVGALQVLPLVIAALIARRSKSAARVAKRLRTLGNLTLAAVIALLVVDRGPMLATLSAPTLVAMSSLAALTAVVGALSGAPRGANSALTIVRNLTLALIATTAPPSVGDTRRVVSGYFPRDCSWRVFLPTGLRSSELTAMRRVAILVAAYGLLMYLTAAAVSIAAKTQGQP